MRLVDDLRALVCRRLDLLQIGPPGIVHGSFAEHELDEAKNDREVIAERMDSHGIEPAPFGLRLHWFVIITRFS